jgi:hypothetical protein
VSWDVLLYSARGTPTTLAELEAEGGIDLPPMGSASEIRLSISAVLPGVDWSDPSGGILHAGGFSIEFNIDADGPVNHVMLHVRGGGDPVHAIAALCKAQGWRALDTVTGICLDPDAPSNEGWRQFQDYRDQLLNEPNPSEE